MKIIEVVADAGHADTLTGIAEQHEIDDIWFGPAHEDGRVAARLLVRPQHRQTVLDALQTVLSSSSNAQILILPVETSILKHEAESDEADNNKKSRTTISREELFSVVERGTNLDSTFFLLVALSSIVAAIGLIENNTAVIIGAMVIAPLLGPNLAFALGASLGEKDLIIKSLQAISSGIALAVGIAYMLGLVWSGSLNSPELMSRTEVLYSSTAIALASGAAGSLSLVTGVSAVLVGVMVAVALMPPAVTIGLMMSIADWDKALGATLLLAVNIVSVNLAAKLVFLVRGIQPRTWLESRKARQSRTLYFILWLVLFAVLFFLTYLRLQVN